MSIPAALMIVVALVILASVRDPQSSSNRERHATARRTVGTAMCDVVAPGADMLDTYGDGGDVVIACGVPHGAGPVRLRLHVTIDGEGAR